jgi:cell division protein FtsW
MVCFGVVMVYSAAIGTGNATGMLLTQARWAVLGLVAMGVLMRIDYHVWARPAIVPARNGAHRWILLGPFSGQPSELAKIALVIFLGWFLTQREGQGRLGRFTETVLPSGVLTGVLAGLVLKEPDLGTTAMLGLIFIIMLFVGGVPLRHLFMLSPLAMIGGYLFVMKVGWRMDRVMTFLDPERDPQGKGYQVIQSLIAVGSGGVKGAGLGQGKQKLLYLPEAHSDFIFAVIAEELGLIGAVTVVFLFVFFLWRGLRACHRAPDRFGYLVAAGLTTMIIAQAFFNISVVLSLAPTKGIPLPFISAGGSSLVVTLAAVGILLNISGWGRAR